MTPARSHTATAGPPSGPTASSGLRLHLSPTLTGVGIWFRTMDPHMLGVTRASQDRLALLVVPPEAAGQAAQRAMTMAADPTNGAGPAAVLTAAGIASEDHVRT